MKALGLSCAALMSGFVFGCSAHVNSSQPQTPGQSTQSSTLAAQPSDGKADAELAPLGPAVPMVEPAPEPAATNSLPPEGAVGVIDRAGLVMIIDAGLGRFFQRVRVSPELKGNQFVGFRITQIDPAWSNVPLRVGDVIRRVNGQPIERPEQAMSAFELLRSADEVVVELTREGVEATIRLAIR